MIPTVSLFAARSSWINLLALSVRLPVQGSPSLSGSLAIRRKCPAKYVLSSLDQLSVYVVGASTLSRKRLTSSDIYWSAAQGPSSSRISLLLLQSFFTWFCEKVSCFAITLCNSAWPLPVLTIRSCSLAIWGSWARFILRYSDCRACIEGVRDERSSTW